jgi:tetratricopeptide (TPR) repeat protein
MAGFFRKLFVERSARPSSTLLDERELGRIGTDEDPLKNYEAASERNFRAMEAEQRGDVDLAVSLYEESVAEGFVEAHPYERLANLYEQRGRREDALGVTQKFIALAKSGRLPRGSQRSADRRLPEFEARAGKFREARGEKT